MLGAQYLPPAPCTGSSWEEQGRQPWIGAWAAEGGGGCSRARSLAARGAGLHAGPACPEGCCNAEEPGRAQPHSGRQQADPNPPASWESSPSTRPAPSTAHCSHWGDFPAAPGRGQPLAASYQEKGVARVNPGPSRANTLAHHTPLTTLLCPIQARRIRAPRANAGRCRGATWSRSKSGAGKGTRSPGPSALKPHARCRPPAPRETGPAGLASCLPCTRRAGSPAHAGPISASPWCPKLSWTSLGPLRVRGTQGSSPPTGCLTAARVKRAQSLGRRCPFPSPGRAAERPGEAAVG